MYQRLLIYSNALIGQSSGHNLLSCLHGLLLVALFSSRYPLLFVIAADLWLASEKYGHSQSASFAEKERKGTLFKCFVVLALEH